ncbi:MAG: hypothetical protein N3C58_01260 [Meiothermus ruber]|nr:hypothetical protein [Meiothermus ruber]
MRAVQQSAHFTVQIQVAVLLGFGRLRLEILIRGHIGYGPVLVLLHMLGAASRLEAL